MSLLQDVIVAYARSHLPSRHVSLKTPYPYATSCHPTKHAPSTTQQRHPFFQPPQNSGAPSSPTSSAVLPRPLLHGRHRTPQLLLVPAAAPLLHYLRHVPPDHRLKQPPLQRPVRASSSTAAAAAAAAGAWGALLVGACCWTVSGGQGQAQSGSRDAHEALALALLLLVVVLLHLVGEHLWGGGREVSSVWFVRVRHHG